ncbi:MULTISPECIES: DNA-3-methyladenine glycosylase [unclassified Curtobacterium]|uniref:DNA-3-methyladenine glycosylase n=1 Tax=unclassified Curtobacterium TaxID=257496 RepID=UPI0021ACB4AF|nr:MULTISPECIES: DNA-3-methyladenine glycosylase [unclassified Curtobacterium]WIB64509.1 DNA-3-methyladenine glycosylase [Curtobacterium sp. MCBD17_040]
MIDEAGVLGEPALAAAPALLGATITGRGVTVRITEVEAYMGETDPGSHAFRGPRQRNRHLFGAPGTLYAYRSYGIHTCLNVVSGPDGFASGSLLRAGAVVEGVSLARERRGDRVPDVGLARGPGNLGQALGAMLTDDGSSVLDGRGPYVLRFADGLEERLASSTTALLDESLADGRPRISVGPRVGVGGVAGGRAFPWRFWLTGEPTVSSYRRHPQATD